MWHEQEGGIGVENERNLERVVRGKIGIVVKPGGRC
jgi:hypothetical protein